MINQIAFPKLGIDLSINRVAFTIFGKDIYWYGIIIAIGFVLGVYYALSRVKKAGLSGDNILDVILWGLPTCIICARIFYVIGDAELMQGGFMKMIAIWDGGIAISGAIIGAVVVGVVYCKVKKIDMGALFDVCAPGIMIGQIVGRWGNFVNCEVYGGPTDSILGMSINGGECVQPLFLYESSLMLVGFIILAIYQNYKKKNGEIFLGYLLWYGTVRAILEPMRQEEYILRLFGMPISQLISIAMAVVAVCGIIYLYTRKTKAPIEEQVLQDDKNETEETVDTEE